MEKFFRFHRDKRALTWALVFAIVCVLFYLWSIQNILFTDSGYDVGFLLVDNWQDLLFRQRVALLWEPIAVWVPFSGFSLLFAPPNILLAFFLSILIYANILVAVYAYRMNKITGVKFSFKGILGHQEAVTTAEQGHEQLIDDLILADDHLVDLVLHRAIGLLQLLDLLEIFVGGFACFVAHEVAFVGVVAVSLV